MAGAPLPHVVQDTHVVLTVPSRRGSRRTRGDCRHAGTDASSAAAGAWRSSRRSALPDKVAERFDLAGMAGHARHRPHPHGDRSRRSRPPARIRSRPAPTSASCTTARCRTTTTCAESSCATAMRFQTENDTEVAAAYLTWRMREGDTLEQALEALARRPRRLLHLRRRHARRLRRAARSDRLQAGGDGRDRRLGRLRLEYPRAGARCRASTSAQVWEPEPATVYFWSRSLTWRASPRERVDLAQLHARPARCSMRRAAPAAARHQRAATGAILNPRGRARHRRRARRADHVEIDGHVGYYCAGMNKQRHRHGPRQCRHRRRREHDVGPRAREGRRLAVGRRHRLRRPAGRSTATPRRAAASR